MSNIKIHVLHTGKVCISPSLAFGGGIGKIRASGIFQGKDTRIWTPVSAYLIEHPKGTFLVDTGWGRSMSPEGRLDKRAQVKSLGSLMLYKVNQGVVPAGQCIDEQLRALGIATSEIDAVLMTHLDCDHANGLEQVRDAKRFLVSAPELEYASRITQKTRYHRKWWSCVNLETFDWNDTEGPFNTSFNLLGDKSIELIWIPGHSAGLCAVKVRNDEGAFALLFSDGGYAKRSWENLIPSGIASDRSKQMASLKWIRQQSLDPMCLESLANHDPDIVPHVIEL